MLLVVTKALDSQHGVSRSAVPLLFDLELLLP